MDILTKLKGLSGLGARTLAQSVSYALRRDAAERGTKPAPARPVSPGALQSWEKTPHGARFAFEHASLEVEFLAADLARATWQPGALPVPWALAGRAWPGAAVAWRAEDGAHVGSTGALSVSVGADGSLAWRDGAGALLREELPPSRRGTAWTHLAKAHEDEHWFGLGERTMSLDLRGHTYRLWNLEAKGSYLPGQDPLYLGAPVFTALRPGASYLVFFENTFEGTASFGPEPEATFIDGALRYYLIPGPPARALERYGELTGTTPLPPRWALGFHQARWSYLDEAEVREVEEGFRSRGLPLAAIHLDIHYMDGYRVFTFDPKRFPDPKRLIADLAARGVRTVVIQDPGVKVDPDWEIYRDGLAQDVFCKLPDGRPAVAPVWPGDAVFPDFTDPKARAWWGSYYPRLVDLGVAGVWHDMNEPAAFAAWGEPTLPRTTRHACEGRGGDHREAHNLYGMLESRAAFEALRRLRPESRPFLVSRSGWAGLQRYSWSWTGDSESTWWTLHQTVRMTLSLGLSGLPCTGPDIGGFGGEPDAELYARWFQLGSILPFFRVHSAWFTPRREPWRFGEETLAICREHLALRKRLMPYLYTLAREMARTGHPWARPLWWPDGADRTLWEVDDAFLVGEALLAAPVVTPGARRRAVRLPAGTWYSLWDDTVLPGPAEVEIDAPPERLPLLARAGSVVPMDEDERLVLHVFAPEPGGSAAGGLLYSDAGDGYGESRTDRFALSVEGERLVLVRASEGAYAFPWKSVGIALHGSKAGRAKVDGREVALEKGRAEVGFFERIEIG